MDRPRRNFNPAKTRRYGFPTFDPDKLVKYSPKHEVSRVMNFPFRGSHFRPRMRSVVISTDGGSRGNNENDPCSRAAYGVFFGPSCRYNRCSTLQHDVPQLSNRAELEAVRQALRIVQSRRRSGEFDGWRQIIIKTDSQHVSNVLSDWVWNWQANGWTRSQGKAIKNLDLIQDLQRTICSIEEWGAVRFWAVGREWNTDADALVNLALNAGNDSGYTSR